MTKITRLSGAAVCKKPVLNLSENVRWMTKRLESDLDYELRYKTCDAKKLKRLLGYQNALIQEEQLKHTRAFNKAFKNAKNPESAQLTVDIADFFKGLYA